MTAIPARTPTVRLQDSVSVAGAYTAPEWRQVWDSVGQTPYPRSGPAARGAIVDGAANFLAILNQMATELNGNTYPDITSALAGLLASVQADNPSLANAADRMSGALPATIDASTTALDTGTGTAKAETISMIGTVGGVPPFSSVVTSLGQVEVQLAALEATGQTILSDVLPTAIPVDMSTDLPAASVEIAAVLDPAAPGGMRPYCLAHGLATAMTDPFQVLWAHLLTLLPP